MCIQTTVEINKKKKNNLLLLLWILKLLKFGCFDMYFYFLKTIFNYKNKIFKVIYLIAKYCNLNMLLRVKLRFKCFLLNHLTTTRKSLILSSLFNNVFYTSLNNNAYGTH